MNIFSACLPSNSATLLVVHLNKLAKTTGVVVMCRLCVPKCLWVKEEEVIFLFIFDFEIIYTTWCQIFDVSFCVNLWCG